MKKRQQLIAGILTSAMVLSTVMTPGTVEAKQKKPVTVSVQQNKQSDLKHNQTAIDFISYCDEKQYSVWNQSLGEMNDTESQEIENCVKEIVKGETEDYKKAALIYEWIVKNISYAGPTDVPGLRPYDVFKTKKAVCGGFSRLYKAMLNLAGIPSITVAGNTPYGAHEWNLVYADKEWFYSDSTWGASSMDYFHKTIEEFSKEHRVQRLVSVTQKGENDTIIGFWEGVAVVYIEKDVKNVVVPEKFKDLNITAVSSDIFNRTGIERLEVSKNVTKIDAQGASNATELKEITVDSENTVYASVDGVLFTKDYSEILHYPIKNTAKLFTIPKETTSLDTKQTFISPYLENIYVEKENEKYSSYEGAVYNKDKTELIIIPEGKKSVTVFGSVDFSKSELSPFNSKRNLEEIILQDGIKEIPADTFNSCTGLRKITIPESVNKIDEWAFTNVNLNQFTILGKSGSAAETYAKKHNIKFSALDTPAPKPEKPEAELKTLNETIAKADKVDVSLYTEESVEKFNQALKSARIIAAKEDVTKEEVVEATEALQKAMKALEEKPAPKPEKPEAELKTLNEMIAKADKVDVSLYTEESVEKFNQALKSARIIATKEDVTKEEVVEATEALQKAMKALEEKPAPKPEKPEAELKTLNAMIAKADKVDVSLYTEESVEKFNQALKSARMIAAKEDVTKEEVVEATEALQKAMKALKKKPAANPEKENAKKPAPETGDLAFPALPSSLIALSGAVALLLSKKKK